MSSVVTVDFQCILGNDQLL